MKFDSIDRSIPCFFISIKIVLFNRFIWTSPSSIQSELTLFECHGFIVEIITFVEEIIQVRQNLIEAIVNYFGKHLIVLHLQAEWITRE